MNPDRPHKEWHSRGYLPHFDHAGLIQGITFRLADSLPAEKIAQWRTELGLLAGARASCPQAKETKIGQDVRAPASRIEYHRRIEEWLDRGQGTCLLRNPRLARIIEDALLHFDGERYRLAAWVVMPNHVHVLVETMVGHRLGDVVHSWKSFTAKEINRILGRTGPVWQEEYFDRFIRNGDHLRETIRYIEKNPVEVGLVERAEDWLFGSARHRSASILPA